MLKTQEFRTKDFFVRSTHSIERVGRQILSSLEGAIQKKCVTLQLVFPLDFGRGDRTGESMLIEL